MKCESLACIWSASPPSHRVTAAAVLEEPPTLYTGGCDGAIIWWNFVSSLEKPLIPVALLCGHAAPVADLAICFPSEASDFRNLGNSISSPSYPDSDCCGALISVCKDGVLCAWSRTGGYCRRRRKVPTWAGSPLMMKPLIENKRYVCIACSFVKHEHQPLNVVEGYELLTDRESEEPDSSRCAVIIIDSFTLTLVQTVFHGDLPAGSLKFMDVVLHAEDVEKKQLVMIVDSCGKVLYLPIRKDPDQKGHSFSSAAKSTKISEDMDWADDNRAVALSRCGNILALVHASHCTFRHAETGNVLGVISFLDGKLCFEDKSYVVGGVFLENDISFANNMQFVAWSNRGAAILYRISLSGATFKFDALSFIPPASYPSVICPLFSFLSLSKYLLRVESFCVTVEEHVSWRSNVSIWLLPQPDDYNSNLCLECVSQESNLFGIWAEQFSSNANASSCHENHENKNAFWQGGELVSSSMVISEDCLSPWAVVYGFFNGDIEIVKFDMVFTSLDSSSNGISDEAEKMKQKKCLFGHKGAVLCLASHFVESRPVGSSLNHVLMSGGMDCTVRLWDIVSGDPIVVLHQHVAPVRQIIIPPCDCEYPWSNCFLTVADDLSVALASLQTLRVERLFPGHLYYPTKVLWDGVRGYIACLCPSHCDTTDSTDILYIWDMKTGARERVLRGASAHSMFDHFLRAVSGSTLSGNVKGNTSASCLLFPLVEPIYFSQSHAEVSGKGTSHLKSSANRSDDNVALASKIVKGTGPSGSSKRTSVAFQRERHPIRSSSPFPGVSTLRFDLNSLMSLCSMADLPEDGHVERDTHLNRTKNSTTAGASPRKEPRTNICTPSEGNENHFHVSSDVSAGKSENHKSLHVLEECLLQFSLSFLHVWNIDTELDELLVTEMKLKRPTFFVISTGIFGDRGSMTLAFPGSTSALELWKSSSEYSALRSLTMVSLAQHLISLSHSCSAASSALAAFYTRKLLEKVPGIKPPLLQLLGRFWQNEIEHVRMAARSLFHCSASWTIPRPLCSSNAYHHGNFLSGPYQASGEENERSDEKLETPEDFVDEESRITSWLESYEKQEWISCVGGTTQDAMASQIIVAAALAVWYPSLVKSQLSTTVIHPLVKLVMAMNEKYSAAAAEILAEGMESTWKECLGSEIPRLIGDILFQVECVRSASANVSSKHSAASVNMLETLVGILLPSLAMADSPGFLHVIERQIWSTSSDSPVHVVSLMTLIRAVRGSPRNLSPYLDKVVTFILQTMDPGNSTMRKSCLKSALTALKDAVRVFPMIALNAASTRLAVGDAMAEVNKAVVRVYDMQSLNKIKVLDASGPLGLPKLLGSSQETTVMTAISALSFSPDGEGIIAFSENGLMLRWWSNGSVWWEKLSKTLVPVQCTKLVFVPPWEGFAPNSTRSSIMATAMHSDVHAHSPGSARASGETDRMKQLIQNLDLSYRLEWVGERKVKLSQHAHDLGTFQL